MTTVLEAQLGIHRDNRADIAPRFSQSPMDWKHATQADLDFLQQFLNRTARIARQSHDMNQQAVAEKLNPDEKFAMHLKIMDAYMDALSEIPQFANFIAKMDISPTFLHVLVHLHDYGRFIFNGPFPLPVIDGKSAELMRKNIPGFPDEYLHSISWITGEKKLPVEDEFLTKPEKIALMLKAIDTIGKPNAQGEPIDLDTFFVPGGSYSSWMKKQVEIGRLPFTVKIMNASGVEEDHVVSADEYQRNDEAITLRGIRFLQEVTGTSFDKIRQRVVEKLNASESIAATSDPI